MKRKSVTIEATKPSYDGPISLLRIVYVDGRVSYAVSLPGMLHLFGADLDAAKKHFAVSR